MTDLQKLECYRCKKLLAENLVLPKGLCVYCAADEAEQLPQPKKEQKTQSIINEDLIDIIISGTPQVTGNTNG